MADPAHWRPGPLRRVLPGEAPPGRPLPRGLPGSGRAAGLGGLITPAEASWKKLSLSERNRPDRRRPITSQAMPAPLLAVDAPFLLYRSFFALPDSIHGVDDRPVNALLGAANALLRIAADRRPRAIVVCFGAEAAHYRVELFAPYHADRPPVPDALAWQFEQAPGFFESFGWSTHTSSDLEADDLLG